MWRLRSHSILIASDGEPDPAIQPAFLEQPGVKLFTSAHEHALAIAQRERPTVIIEDLRQPRPVALESCRRLRDDRRTRAIPMILVGSRALHEDLGAVRAEAVVSHPIVQQEYFEAVRRFVPLPQRRETRHPVNLRFTYRCGERRGQTFSRDLSVDGALLNTDAPLPVGACLELAFRLPGQEQEIRCEGAIVRRAVAPARAQPAAAVAIQFGGMGESDRWRLESFLARQSSRR